MTQTPPISAEQVEALVERTTGRLFDALDLTRHGYRFEDIKKLSREILNASASIPASRGVEAEVLTGFDETASAAWDFVRPKLLEMNREKGAAGVWSTGYRSGWDAAIRAASPPEQELRAETERLEAEIKRLKTLNADLLMQAQGHAMEARTANRTIYEIYQVLTGATGEPGNWHGAEPAREYVARYEAKVERLTEALRKIAEHPEQFDNGRRSYAVGWAFWNIQNIAKDRLRAEVSP